MTDEAQSSEPPDEDSAISFAAFVLSLAHTAAIHFGDMPDPVSGAKPERNLPAAQQMIDVLALLEQKTRGNLTMEERQLLDQVLFELRLRYVEAGKEGGTSASQSRIILP